jgi:large subunit ribosomal protein L6
MSSIGAKPLLIAKDISFQFTKNCNYSFSRNEVFIYCQDQNSKTWSIELKGNYTKLTEKVPQTFGIRFYLNENIQNLQELSETHYQLKPGLAHQLKLEKLTKKTQDSSQTTSKRQEKLQARNKNLLWGSLRQKLKAGLEASSQGLKLGLNLSGLGFKAFKEEENTLLLKLGFSHTIKVHLPSDIQFHLGSDTNNPSPATSKTEGQKILLVASNKTLLHSIADQISKLRSPEPYKGKGIIIQKPEILRKLKLQRKQGKKKSN